MNELVIEATRENLTKVLSFVDEHLKAAGCNMRTQIRFLLIGFTDPLIIKNIRLVIANCI